MKHISCQAIKDKKLLILILLGIVFFFIYSYLSLTYGDKPVKFTSPDETVNYFYSKLYAEQSTFKLFEPLNDGIGEVIYPRNAYVVGEYIVPGSFLGLPFYYGLLAKIFSINIILFLTPLLSILGVIFFYKLIKKVFNSRVAFLASILLFIQPVFWYYSQKGMWHNAPFLSLFIMGLYFLSRLNNRKISDYIFAGIFISLALAFRTAEFFWVIPLILFFMVIYWRKINKGYLLMCLVIAILIFAPIAYHQKMIFGSYFSVGYTQEITREAGTLNLSAGLMEKFKNFFTRFGLDTENVWANFYNYTVYFLFVLFSGTLFGLFVSIRKLIKKSLKKSEIIYLILFILISIWLIVFYGSYEFREFLDPETIVFGSSYFRYWLPIYVFGLPFLVLFLYWLKAKLSYRGRVIWIFLISVIIYSCFYLVILDPYYGLVKTKNEDISGHHELLKKVLEETEQNSLIVAGSDEKALWPERKVVSYNFNLLREDKIVKLPKIFEKNIPIYYLSLIPQELERINYLLREDKVFFEFVKEIDAKRKLYRLTELKP